ncbi:hypothetical protein H5T51_01825 [Candidatus Bathyarchaeota archaeon]|nr:hypothetical protein [Candidatus Bathyarchaeota archaeon]
MPFEILNPVDTLFSPLNTFKFLELNMADRLYILEENPFAHMIVERYSIWENGLKNILCVNAEAVNSKIVIVDNQYISSLKEKAAKTFYPSSLEEWNSIFEVYGSMTIRSCYKRASEDAEYMVVEGFNDAICPEKTLKYDVVVGVAPGVAVFYEAENFHRLLETMEKLGRDPASLRAKDVVKYLRKIRILNIPPITVEYIKDYDRLSCELNTIVNFAFEMAEKKDEQIKLV